MLFIINQLIYLLHIPIAAQFLYSPSICLVQLSSSLEYHPTLAQAVPVRLSALPPTEAHPGSLGSGRESSVSQQSQRQPLLQLLRDPYENQAVPMCSSKCVRVLGPASPLLVTQALWCLYSILSSDTT